MKNSTQQQIILEPENNNKSKVPKSKFVHQLADIPNFENKVKYGCLVAEPGKYLATMLLINLSMIIVYISVARPTLEPPSYWYLVIIVGFFHVLSVFLMVVLALADPGIIPKIFSRYENKQYKRIPIRPEYVDNSAGETETLFYTATVKTHALKLKFCDTCYIFRPPRATHCY